MKVYSILISCDNNKYECNCIRGPFGQEYNSILKKVNSIQYHHTNKGLNIMKTRGKKKNF